MLNILLVIGSRDRVDAAKFLPSLNRLGGCACIFFFSFYRDYRSYLNPAFGDFDLAAFYIRLNISDACLPGFIADYFVLI